ncbi:MAG: ArsR/SmtB family transcription factor [Acidimicrobiales bacterium]
MSDELSEMFGALADPTRRRLVDDLASRLDGATATELARVLPVTRQAVVKHLQVLVRAGLAEARRHGREVRYLARPSSARPAAAWIDERTTAWERRFERLSVLLDDGPPAESPPRPEDPTRARR